MNMIVQKFGGTSVASKISRKCVVSKIVEAKKNGFAPIVVVSAMGRKGQPYATDSLLSMLSTDFKKKNLLATDLLMSCGEIISTCVLCNELAEYNIQAVPLTGGQAGILTDDNFSEASIKEIRPEKLLEIIDQGKIPVVAGFQGASDEGYFTTLGRGGSDVTASLLGVGVKAHSIEIYTDVDGIMTADPRIVKSAALIKEISYNEVFQLAEQGAKVIHPRAVEIAMRGNVPLLIKNTMSDSTGTTINVSGSLNSKNVITGITYMSNRTQIRIKMFENIKNPNYSKVFSVLADNNISIDLINVIPNENIFTIDDAQFDEFYSLMNNLKIKFSFINNCSKIAIIGSRMRGIPGVMAKIVLALTKENVEILQTADSHTTIWCLVKKENTKKSINSLHKEFCIDK
ncbi:aspartate kinase [Clostridium sp. DL1XJH146]